MLLYMATLPDEQGWQAAGENDIQPIATVLMVKMSKWLCH